MDLCVNRSAGDEERRKAEIQDACRILETAKKHSAAASTFLDSLDTVLQKHRVRLKQQVPNAVEMPSPMAASGEGEGRWRSQQVNVTGSAPAGDLMQSTSPEQGANAAPGFDDVTFDQLWQSCFDFGTFADAQSWDALFSDLDMRIE